MNKGEVAPHPGRRVHKMEIEMHDAGGYTITHHHKSSERGVYHEPETNVHSHHGSLMEHIHKVVKKHGKDMQEGQSTGDICEYCDEDPGEKGERKGASGGTGKKDLGGRKDYA